jgi:hypothetical protein
VLTDATAVDTQIAVTPTAPSPRRAVDAGVPRDVVVTYSVDGALPPERVGALPTGFVRIVRTRSGAAVVWAADTGSGGSEIYAQRLDLEGQRIGAPRLLYEGRGGVAAFDVDARHGVLWLGWLSTRGNIGRHRLRSVWALTARDDLGAVRGPLRLGNQRVSPIERPWRDLFAEVRAGDDGTAMILASADNSACAWGPPVLGRVNWVSCAGWKWYRVQSTLRLWDDGRGGMIRPEVTPTALTRVPGGWIFARGPTDGITPQRIVGEALTNATRARILPAFVENVSSCDRPRVAWTGSIYVLACTPAASAAEPEGTVWMRAVRDDGTSVTPARNTITRVTGELMRCIDGKPVIELRWERGLVRIDPTHPDASLRLEQWNAGAVLRGVDVATWAGRAIVGVNTRSGAILRWGCDANGEVRPLE